MKNQITIREAVTENDAAAFWEQLHAYHKRDIFTDSDKEELEYFLGQAYRDHMMKINGRPQDRCFFLFFHRGGQDIGFAMPVIFTTEDGKCFIMEFCVYPEFRGSGTGKACAAALLDWAKKHGARYAELNYGGNERRRRFWESVGFIENGADQWGEPLMLLPPQEDAPMTVGLANGIEEFWALELSFFAAVGETPPDSMGRSRMIGAMSAGRVAFITVKRLNRPIGLCSVSRCFSSFTCWDMGVLDDFYIEPAFRGKGAARMLVEKAAEYCRKQGMQSLAVTCSDVDLELYRALGFTTRLGTNLTMPLPYES